MGDYKQNSKDCLDRGRYVHADASGEKNGRAKLSLVQVEEIKAMYKTGNYFQKEIALKYCVTQSLISCITRGANWKK
jgi:hypothetical protein